jgi:hypothetical protein
MRFICIITLAGLACAFAQAGGEIVPAQLAGEMRYDEVLGRVGTAPLSRSDTPALWSVADLTGDAFVGPEGYTFLDWGDIEAGLPIGLLAFTYVTNSQATAGDNQILLCIYSNENGWNSTGRQLVAGYSIENIPGSTHSPSEYWGYLWRIAPWSSFVIDGDDLDGDGLVDFGYSIRNQRLRSRGSQGGVRIAGPTDPERPQYSAGIEDAFDLFSGDNYLGAYDFGGDPFAQLYFELYAPSCSNTPIGGGGCPGDLNFDCMVDLSDLATLLANYGVSEGAVWWEGDISPERHPLPGDGSVDLSDLAALLSNYGTNCRHP